MALTIGRIDKYGPYIRNLDLFRHFNEKYEEGLSNPLATILDVAGKFPKLITKLETIFNAAVQSNKNDLEPFLENCAKLGHIIEEVLEQFHENLKKRQKQKNWKKFSSAHKQTLVNNKALEEINICAENAEEADKYLKLLEQLLDDLENDRSHSEFMRRKKSEIGKITKLLEILSSNDRETLTESEDAEEMRVSKIRFRLVCLKNPAMVRYFTFNSENKF